MPTDTPTTAQLGGPTGADAALVFRTLMDDHHHCTPAELRELERMYDITHNSHRDKTNISNTTHRTGGGGGRVIHTERYNTLVAPLRQRLHDIRTAIASRKRAKLPVTGLPRVPSSGTPRT